MNKTSETYYNSIASEYDFIMDSYPIHKSIRSFVESVFKSIVVTKSNVLDFGGGTGEDLKWLSKKYVVTFFEPSKEMRKVAIKKALENNYNQIQFTNTASSYFENLSEPSFNHKFDAIIANFAVLNSIKNLQDLSEKLNLICKKNCDVFFIVLYRFPNLKIPYIKDQFHKLIFMNSSFSKEFEVKNNNVKSKIYIHSLKNIKKHFTRNFSIINTIHIKDSYFKIIHLKKEN
ncbi:class I SAM-dependent methyltransferase [Tenacibaculum halocynthiae]|uniref:class I SAM-dependent methyltransferase n=1 Tax=Tenacibaculum halocynthiae TaxID=1254437 RepID=UPI003D656914